MFRNGIAKQYEGLKLNDNNCYNNNNKKIRCDKSGILKGHLKCLTFTIHIFKKPNIGNTSDILMKTLK